MGLENSSDLPVTRAAPLAAPGRRIIPAGSRESRGLASRPRPSLDLAGWLSQLGALLLATQLYTAHLLENRFHPDEAHYAAFARLIASGPGRGILLSHIIVDKPPVSFYVNGLSVALIGPSELALRLPALLTSVLNVALVFGLARRLYGAPAAHGAAWSMALSPFAIQFAITAFVDPLLNTLLLAALYLTATRHRYLAAVALALAFATKQTALFAIPLMLLLDVWLAQPAPKSRIVLAMRSIVRAAVPMLVMLVAITAVLLTWDARRGAPIPFWQQGYSDNVPARPIALVELQPRAEAVLSLLAHFTDSRLVDITFLVGLALMLAGGLRRRTPAARMDQIITLYLAAYMALFWLIPFNIWDRYFLPLLPLAALLAGRVLEFFARAVRAMAERVSGRKAQSLETLHTKSRQRFTLLRVSEIALPLLALAAVVPNLVAANYDFSPVGGDHGAYDGIDQTSAFVQTLPDGAILYDHWLGWEFEYYLFERQVRIVWFADMPELTSDIQNYGDVPQYLAAPWWAPVGELQDAAARAGKTLATVHRSFRRDGVVSITIYRVDAAGGG